MPKEDVIDLLEISMGLWARKILIFSCVFISILISIGVALNIDKKFEATTIFAFNRNNNSQSSDPAIAGIAALTGLSLDGFKSDSSGIFDRIKSRDFVLRLNQKVKFDEDAYFNPKNQEQPSSGTKIKTFVIQIVKKLFQKGERKGAKNSNNDLKRSENIYNTYIDSVAFSETKFGSIKIDVEHSDPVRASVIANAIVSQISKELANEEKKS